MSTAVESPVVLTYAAVTKQQPPIIVAPALVAIGISTPAATEQQPPVAPAFVAVGTPTPAATKQQPSSNKMTSTTKTWRLLTRQLVT